MSRTVFLCHAGDQIEFVNFLTHLLQDEPALKEAGVRVFAQDPCLEVGDLKRQTIHKNLNAATLGTDSKQ